ncbi:MAG: hypothetical protein AAB922_00620, partial [Patescibacteria group bacterium]
TASETIEIENLKHSHELQLLDIKDKISQSEHERRMKELELERQISVARTSDPKMIEVLEGIRRGIEEIARK